MPERSMSWLTPKRRRTTGNLKTLGSGQYHPQGGNVARPETPTRLGASWSERPPLSPGPFSQTATIMTTNSNGSKEHGDGNLFYAYARKGDDLTSRYLLTFASASTANEWYGLIQSHFPSTSRPGPQLFSFKTDDLLSKAWRHPAFEHLQTKWMYISFSDTSSDGIGGAAQGIIPVQDAYGNMLGGVASPASSPDLGKATRDVKDMKEGVGRLEENFEKMMEAVERNIEGVRKLAEEREEHDQHEQVAAHSSGYFDMKELTGHFGRMTDLLERNTEHMENMSKKQFENDQKLGQALNDVNKRQQEDHLDLTGPSSQLDRIQNIMERSLQERKDSARSSEDKPSTMDLSPLAERLEKMQLAVEQNSALMRRLLEDGSAQDSDAPRTPFWASPQQPEVDLSPLDQRLASILGAIEEQNSHMQALGRFAGGSSEDGEQSATSHASLSPLAEHLEQIYNAIEEGNRQAKEAATKTKPEKLIDFKPVVGKLDALQNISKENAKHLEGLIDAQKATTQAIMQNGGDLDFSPLADHFETLRNAVENQHTPLLEHLRSIQSATNRNTEQMQVFVENQKSQHQSTPPNKSGSGDIDFTPLTERLNRIHASLEKANKQDRPASPGSGDPKFVLNALTSHLSKIQVVTEHNANAIKSIPTTNSTSNDKLHEFLSETVTALRKQASRTEAKQQRLDERQGIDMSTVEMKLEATNSQVRELMAGHRDMTKVMRELAEAITAQNKGSCDHVVIPPPRKVGRKIVGFVYDAKEGPV